MQPRAHLRVGGVTGRLCEVSLPRTMTAPRIARECLEQWLAPALDEQALYRAMLLTSELVANAVLHGRGEIILRAHVESQELRVDVIDQGYGFQWRDPGGDPDGAGGLGLRIVDAEATRWGIHDGTTHVWFELAWPGLLLVTADEPAS